jgi:hypothetical protein
MSKRRKSNNLTKEITMKILNIEITSPISAEQIKEMLENIVNNATSNVSVSYGQANVQANAKGITSILLIAGVLGLGYLAINKFGEPNN